MSIWWPVGCTMLVVLFSTCIAYFTNALAALCGLVVWGCITVLLWLTWGFQHL